MNSDHVALENIACALARDDDVLVESLLDRALIFSPLGREERPLLLSIYTELGRRDPKLVFRLLELLEMELLPFLDEETRLALHTCLEREIPRLEDPGSLLSATELLARLCPSSVTCAAYRRLTRYEEPSQMVPSGLIVLARCAPNRRVLLETLCLLKELRASDSPLLRAEAYGWTSNVYRVVKNRRRYLRGDGPWLRQLGLRAWKSLRR